HAKNGEDGIKMAEELKPDVITLDIIMPGIDGIETATELLKRNPAAKIVMLSSLCDHDTMAEVQAIGLKHLVAKPIEADKLLSALNEVTSEE
ncbi:MAG: response regulator, partial [Lachnospiraceae bacterium]|nr:response regulator [Lachnospiraceae bacterium]